MQERAQPSNQCISSCPKSPINVTEELLYKVHLLLLGSLSDNQWRVQAACRILLLRAVATSNNSIARAQMRSGLSSSTTHAPTACFFKQQPPTNPQTYQSLTKTSPFSANSFSQTSPLCPSPVSIFTVFRLWAAFLR